MGAIDSDAHVLESQQTWSYIDEVNARHRPMIVSQTEGETVLSNDGTSVQRNYWVVANRMMGKDRNVNQGMTREIREMEDIAGRLRHMDELGIDIQVLYPTLFLRPVTQHVETEYQLCRSYNRWLADVWKQAEDRLRWVAQPPILSMDKVRDEMLFARDNGACGIFLRGLECERTLGDPYFYPLYELSGELDMPICIHSASGSAIVHDFFESDTTFTKFKLAVVGSFHTLLEKAIPTKFPKVRWGFVEVSSQWVPYVLNDLQDRFRRNGLKWHDNPLKDNNMYVACENTDDLDYVLKAAGPDNILIGTDYGHHDPSAEIDAIRLLREDNRVDAATVEKILEVNPRRFYGFD